MKPQPRWMKSVLTDAAQGKMRMPWERGLRRQASIARRIAATQPVKRSA